jgi:copper(I)-binding protein
MRLFRFAALAFVLMVHSTSQLGAQILLAKTLTVADAWSRATPGASKTAVVYMTIVNGGASDDRLVGGATPVAEQVQFHSNVNDNGVMRMRELTAIDVAAGASVTLKPSSTHAMLVGLRQPLKEGQSFPLTLDFEKTGKVEVMVAVGKVGAMGRENTKGM